MVADPEFEKDFRKIKAKQYQKGINNNSEKSCYMAKNELSTKDDNRVNFCQKQLKNGVHLNIKVKFSEHEKGKHTFF